MARAGTLKVQPGDLIGYDESPGEYYWLVWGTPGDLYYIRMDRGIHGFLVPFSATRGQPVFTNHHIVYRRRS